MVPVSRETAEIQKMKNSGNEAKKYLKTKDITFFSAANYARFVRNLASIRHDKEQIGQTLREPDQGDNLAKRGHDSDKRSATWAVAQQSTTAHPSFSKEGNCRTAPSAEEGLGRWDFATLAYFAAWRETGFLIAKTGGTKPECL